MFMSDLSDLGEHGGDYPNAGRWQAETGALAISSYNAATGVRELQPVALGGAESTFVLDLLTRERGFSMYRPGIRDARLTPVGSPPPEWPGDPDFAPCIACAGWNPTFNEIRFETNARLFMNALLGVWERALATEEAARGEQPVIRFEGAAPVFIKTTGKTFQSPIIKIVAFMPRDDVPGWAAKPPTVPLPKPSPRLTAASSSAPAIDANKPAIEADKAKKPARIKKGASKPAPKDKPIIDDEIPWK
jgi:hypothetical protein